MGAPADQAIERSIPALWARPTSVISVTKRYAAVFIKRFVVL